MLVWLVLFKGCSSYFCLYCMKEVCVLGEFFDCCFVLVLVCIECWVLGMMIGDFVEIDGLDECLFIIFIVSFSCENCLG